MQAISYVFLGIWIVLAIVYMVMAYVSSRVWQVGHLIAIVGIVIMTCCFAWLAAMSLKTHQKWQSEYAKLSTDLAAELERQAALPDITELREELGRELLDRGRVWRSVTPGPAAVDNNQLKSMVVVMANWGQTQCTKIGVTGDVADVAVPTEEGVAPVAAVAAPHGIQVSQVLYIYQEQSLKSLPRAIQAALLTPPVDYNSLSVAGPNAAETEDSNSTDERVPNVADEEGAELGDDLAARDTEERCRVPVVYLGKFKVIEISDQPPAIRLEPMERITDLQKRFIFQPQGTWSLYETMPIDSHRALAGLTPSILEAMLPQQLLRLPEAEYRSVLTEYAMDGKSIGGQNVEDIRTETKVKFTREKSFVVDDPNAEVGSDRAFDTQGRAVASKLRQGADTSFTENDEQWFDSVTAKQLIQEGVAERTNEPPRYRRALRDYAFIFSEKEEQLQQLTNNIAQYKSDNQSVIDAAGKATEEIAYRQKERDGLASDLNNFQAEQVILKKVLEQLTAQAQQQRQVLSYLYRENRRLADQLRGRFLSAETWKPGLELLSAND